MAHSSGTLSPSRRLPQVALAISIACLALLAEPGHTAALATPAAASIGVGGARERRRLEVYAWSSFSTEEQFTHLNFSVLDAVGWRTDAPFLKLAAAAGVRVEASAGANLSALFDDAERRRAWIESQVRSAAALGLGGINFDWEDAAAPGSAAAAAYTQLVSETAASMRAAMPGAVVTVDVPWTPYDADGRNFDWRGLAAAADALIVMAYDVQSQLWGRCAAAANSPLPAVARGVRQWLQLGVPPEKLMLGLPWYSYDYECVAGADGRAPAPDVDVCQIAAVPFAGAACSDAAGRQRGYSDIMANVLDAKLNTTAVRWDPSSASHYVNYVDPSTGAVRQVWFDDAASLAPRYAVAVAAGLRGIAIWNVDYLDVTSTDAAAAQRAAEMWAALDGAAHGDGGGGGLMSQL